MFYFRENELSILERFYDSKKAKAIAIYGRRRVGKTELVLNYIRTHKGVKTIYFQCTSFDYSICLDDFVSQIKHYYDCDETLYHLKTFKDVFNYIGKTNKNKIVFIFDEFPFLCKKNQNVSVEFQWIIDHGLAGNKLILLGSNMSFMKNSINDSESPLYGRFDETIEIKAFTFLEVYKLFPKYEDALNVYALTGGVAQYVMYFTEYKDVDNAINNLYFNRNGRLLNECSNMLMQDLKQTSIYVSIIRSIGTTSKDSGTIAKICNLDQRAVFTYISKLVDLEILSVEKNSLSKKKYDTKYIIKDLFFRFHYSFIEPNLSLIVALDKKAKEIVLDEKYQTYLGYVYEEVIRNSLYELASKKKIPFMPRVIGKWWGNVKKEDVYIETEIDIIAYDSKNIIIGECKYKNKIVSEKELTVLIEKAKSVNTGDRKVYYLLASKKGFAKELFEIKNLILIQENKVINKSH